MLEKFLADIRANIVFGTGTSDRLGEITKQYGNRAMVVTCQWPDVQKDAFTKLLHSLEIEGVETVLFDRASPNPTTTSIDEASAIARTEKIDVVIGLGGGSAIDTAKAVALGFAHEGGVWPYTYAAGDYLPIFPEKLLPVIAVTTTSGTGSHVTPYSVLQSPQLHRKTCVAITKEMLPVVSIVDPELVYSLPANQTAVTGFDVFAHAFEAYTHDNSNPIIEALALQTISITLENLHKAYKNGMDATARYNMAVADTLAGLCIALNNTTMPHDIGQAIVGKCPRITHGQSLAIVYPEYLNYALPLKEREFAGVARLFDPSLRDASNHNAAGKLKELIIKWMRELDIFASGSSLGLPDNIKDEVIDETMDVCSFISGLGMSRNQVSDMINAIWYQE